MNKSIARKLSLTEDGFFNNGTNNTVMYSVDIAGYIALDLLKKASILMMEVHPSLRRGIVQKETGNEFILAENPVQVTVVESDNWERVAKQDLTYSFEPTDPHWRLTLINDTGNPEKCVLLVAYHHAIGDGIGGMILIHELLSFYDKLATQNTFKLKEKEILPDILSLQESSQIKSDIDIEDELIKHNSQLTSDLQENLANSNKLNDFHYVLGNKENLNRLLSKCRDKQVSVGCVLFVASNWALARNEWLRMSSKKKSIRINMNMDVNERNRLTPKLGHENIQLLISMLPWKQSISQSDFFWESVEALSSLLSERLCHTVVYQAFNEDCLKENKESWLTDANFSSVGKYPFSNQYGSLRVNHMHLVGSQWCPLFGRYVLLSNSVDAMSYSIVCHSGDSTHAKEIVKDWAELVEGLAVREGDLSMESYLHHQSF
jgi:hypothetical protein